MIISSLVLFGQPGADENVLHLPNELRAEIFRKENTWAGIYHQNNPGSNIQTDMKSFTLTLSDTFSYIYYGKDSLKCSIVCEVTMFLSCEDSLAKIRCSHRIRGADLQTENPELFFNPKRKGHLACYVAPNNYIKRRSESCLQNWKKEVAKKAASLKADW